MKFIKITVFLFFLAFTSHAFSKSNEYYQQTIVHVLTECNSTCQKQIFEQEIKKTLKKIFSAESPGKNSAHPNEFKESTNKN